MQLFTTGQIIQMYLQAREMAHELFGVILVSIWHNVLNFFPSLFAAIAAHNWNTVKADTLIIAGSIVLLYKIMFKKPLLALRSVYR